MKKKHVLILFTVLALSVTSVMKLIPVSKVAASSILGGNKNESILDKLTPTRNRGNLIRMIRMTPMFWEKRIPCLRT